MAERLSPIPLAASSLLAWLVVASSPSLAAPSDEAVERAVEEATALALAGERDQPPDADSDRDAASGEPEPHEQAEWIHIGLLRIRDLTPFGIQRLDLLPAHSLAETPGSWALDVNLSYQNTYTLSDNVADYLREKGDGGRVRITPVEATEILDLPENAYLVDGELGYFDLTAHYRFSQHWGAYVTIPVIAYRNGIFDEVIESFHDQFGFDTANRELARQDDFTVVTRISEARLALFEPPDDGVGDPVFGGRYSLFATPGRWNLVGEAAVKLGFRDHDFFHSSGKTDYGVQVSVERFFRRQALYLTLSQVYFAGVEGTLISPRPDFRKWIATAVAGIEFKILGKVNGIAQLSASPSVIHDTPLEELTEDKYQISGGLQTFRNGWVYRLAITENLGNLRNTPDIGATLSVARVLAAPIRGSSASKHRVAALDPGRESSLKRANSRHSPPPQH